MGLARPAQRGGRQHDHFGVERADDLDIVAKIIELHRVDGAGETGIIPAAPAGDLAALDCRNRLRVGFMDGVSAALDGPGEGYIHPLLEIRPR